VKRIQLHHPEEIQQYEAQLHASAEQARVRLAEIVRSADGFGLLGRIKFEPIGCDPLDPQRPLNLIEQVNQTCTYLVSLQAVRRLFELHPGAAGFRLNLGTAPGTDIESLDGTIAAEVFAATSPKSNRKLQRDLQKVRAVQAAHRYVFFSCPGIPEGSYDVEGAGNVLVWSLGVPGTLQTEMQDC